MSTRFVMFGLLFFGLLAPNASAQRRFLRRKCRDCQQSSAPLGQQMGQVTEFPFVTEAPFQGAAVEAFPASPSSHVVDSSTAPVPFANQPAQTRSDENKAAGVALPAARSESNSNANSQARDWEGRLFSYEPSKLTSCEAAAFSQPKARRNLAVSGSKGSFTPLQLKKDSNSSSNQLESRRLAGAARNESGKHVQGNSERTKADRVGQLYVQPAKPESRTREQHQNDALISDGRAIAGATAASTLSTDPSASSRLTPAVARSTAATKRPKSTAGNLGWLWLLPLASLPLGLFALRKRRSAATLATAGTRTEPATWGAMSPATSTATTATVKTASVNKSASVTKPAAKIASSTKVVAPKPVAKTASATRVVATADAESKVAATKGNATTTRAVVATAAASAAAVGVRARSARKSSAEPAGTELPIVSASEEKGVVRQSYSKDGFEGDVAKNGVWQKPARFTTNMDVTLHRDNLTTIEGICPKTQSLLNAAGIRTFGDLAASTSAQRIEAMLPGGSRFSAKDTTDWSRLAHLTIAPPAEGGATGEYRNTYNQFEHRERDAGNFVSRESASLATQSVQRDDLTAIEGICRDTQELLYNAGIRTYAHLATVDSPRIEKALKAGGPAFSLRDTSRWSREAKAFSLNGRMNSSRRSESRSQWRDDFTTIRGVDSEVQRLFFESGIYNFGDLAIADRGALKNALVKQNSRFASFDVDQCCEQAMRFVPDDFWGDGEREAIEDVRDLQQEMDHFTGLWGLVTEKVKKGGEQVLEKINAGFNE